MESTTPQDAQSTADTDAQDAPVQPDAEGGEEQVEAKPEPLLTPDEERLHARVMRLLDSGPGSANNVFPPKEFKQFLLARLSTEHPLGEVPKAQLARYARGEERTPKAMGDRLEALLEDDEVVAQRFRRWARGLAAILVLVGEVKPEAEEGDTPEPEQPAAEEQQQDQE